MSTTPETKPKRKPKFRKTLVERRRLLPDDCIRCQVGLSEELMNKAEAEALKMNCASMSEYFRRVLDERFKLQDKGSRNLEERVDASMKELRKRVNGLHLGQRSLYATFCQLLIATDNEHLIEAALSNGEHQDRFSAVTIPDRALVATAD
jgi:hypothetical protein